MANALDLQKRPRDARTSGGMTPGGTPMQAESIPVGLCQCGCGQETNLATYTTTALGRVRGKPYRFVNGHSRRKALTYTEEDRGHKTPCWVFDRPRTPAGYGRFDGKVAHRHLYEQHRGPIPVGLHLDHLCRVPSCCNPWHLEAVTNAENGRRGNQAKLNWSTVTAIRLMKATTTVSQTAMAEMHGVSDATISEIVNYRIWEPEKSFPDAYAEVLYLKEHP